MEKSIIIIGAGIAGLSAGCYGQMNGYRTRIFEQHNQPGGLCTAWKRKGYTFDGCISWLVGSAPGTGVYPIWEELGAVQNRQFVNHDEFFRIEGEGGKTLIVYTSIDRFAKHLKELAPNDTAIIDELAQAVRVMSKFGSPVGKAGELYNWFDYLKLIPKMAPFGGIFKKYGSMTVRKFAEGFSDPFLRKAFGSFFSIPDFPMIAFLSTLGWMHRQAAGYPIGGSLEFSRAIEGRYLDLGGEIHYQSRVVKILTEENRAVGVRLADGSEHRADRVVSAADGHATIYEMLEGKYIDAEIERRYREMPIFQPLIQVSLGVNRDLGKEPHQITYQLKQPISIAGKLREEIGVRHYCYDPTMAPAGKSVLVVMFDSNYQYWKELGADRGKYRAEKESIAELTVRGLEQRFPGLAGQIEVIDVATPLTFERYTGNWQGSFEGWLITIQTFNLKIKKTLPGLDDFYMIGQWVQPGGGLPPEAQAGRDLIQVLCKKDRKRFGSNKPKAVPALGAKSAV